jgi:hypothetical protein
MDLDPLHLFEDQAPFYLVAYTLLANKQVYSWARFIIGPQIRCLPRFQQLAGKAL